MTDYRKLLFIINRHSGKNRISGRLTDLVEIFCQHGYMPTVHVTCAQGDATQVIKEIGADYPLVLCAGGDGTLSECVAGLMALPEEKRPAIGYIPAGSTNDFAATLHLPTDMVQCANQIATGQERRLDTGLFCQERSFVYVAAFGAFTEASYATPQKEKNLLGYNAYILHGLKELSNLRSYQMTVTLDGETVEGRFLYGMACNANSVGGFRSLSGQEAVLDDGALEVLLIRAPATTAEWPQLLADLLAKKYDSRYVITGRAKTMVFDCEEVVDWVLDGEYGGAHQNATVDTCHQSLRFVLPPV